jgi:hypothetical protein
MHREQQLQADISEESKHVSSQLEIAKIRPKIWQKSMLEDVKGIESDMNAFMVVSVAAFYVLCRSCQSAKRLG